MPRRASSSASACAGKRCPPVPPAASSTDAVCLRHFCTGPVGLQAHNVGQQWRLFEARHIRPAPRQRQQHAERDRHRQHRGAARGNEGQRDALGGQQPDVDAHIDQRLQPEQERQPLDRQPRRRVRLLRRRDQRAHDDEGEQSEQHEAGDDAVLLGDDGEDEVGVRIGQRRLDRALARAAAEEAAFGERLDGAVELRVVAGRRREELVDAEAHVGEGRSRRRPTPMAPHTAMMPAPSSGCPDR